MVFLISEGMNIGKDTLGYVNTIPIRSAGYSTVMLLFQMLFGAYALKFLFITQLIVLLFSILYFLSYLKIKFQLSNFVILLISFIFYFYYYKYGRNIATEPLSYAFFLLFIKFILEAIFENKNKSLYISYGLLIVLVLFRGQFYFLYPIIILAVFFIFFKNKNWKNLVKNLTYFIIIIVIANLLDRTYHYVRHGNFSGTPFTGLQVVSDALYVSKLNDSILFEGIDKEMYLKIHQRISEQGFTLESLREKKEDVGPGEIIFHYNHAYNEISHRNAKIIVGSYFESPEDIGYWINIDRTTLEMAKKLIKSNPVKFFKLYIYDILRNGFLSNSFLIFFTIVLSYSLLLTYKSPNNELNVFLVLASLIVVFNYLLVALVEPILDRYSIYSNVIYYTALFIIVPKLYDNKIVNR